MAKNKQRYNMKVARVGLLALAFISTLVFAGPSQRTTPDDPMTLLQNMMHFLQNNSYTAIMIHQQMHGPLDAVKIFHRYDHQYKLEKVVFLDGSGKQLIQNNGTLFASGFKASNLYWHQNIEYFDDSIPINIEQLNQSYRIHIIGHTSIAQRPTTIVELTPKKNQLYRWKLWIGDRNAMLLQTMMISQQGQILERHTIVPVSIGSIPLSEFIVPKNAITQTIQWHHKNTPRHHCDLLPIHTDMNVLPGGFVLVSTHHFFSQTTQGAAEQFIYSNGINKLSVFIESWNTPQKTQQQYLGRIIKKQIKSTVEISTLVKHNQHTFMVTVIGNIPMTAVETALATVKHDLLKPETP